MLISVPWHISAQNKNTPTAFVWSSMNLDKLNIADCYTSNGNVYAVNDTNFIYYHASKAEQGSWEKINANNINDRYDIPVNIESIYVYNNLMLIALKSYGLFASLDNGKTWKRTKIKNFFFSESHINGFVDKASNKLFVFIAGDAQIRRTIIDINHPNEIMSSPWVTLLPVAYSEYTQLQYFNGKIYASSHSFERRRGAIFVTSNYGNTWKEINIYPPVIHAKTPIAVYQIYIQDNTIYAATNYGLYMSKNGIDWQCAGFKNKTVQSIYILNKTLHAAVYDDGIYSSSDSLHWDHEDDSSINKNKSDFGNINYNPFCITGKNTIIVGTSVGLYSVNG